MIQFIKDRVNKLFQSIHIPIRRFIRTNFKFWLKFYKTNFDFARIHTCNKEQIIDQTFLSVKGPVLLKKI